MTDSVLVDHKKLARAVSAILGAAGVPEYDADLVADCLVDADLGGVSSHGVTRVKMYMDGMAAGGSSPVCHYETLCEAPATAVLDVKGALGIPAAERAMRLAIEKARVTGIAMVNVRHSNHCGAAGYFARMAVQAGMIGIVVSNAPAAMAPWGSAERFLGTNPLAIAIPIDGEAFSLDMATSTVARGKIILAGKTGESIPLGWAVDENGMPTTDPAAGLRGSVVPFGGAKGSGIAMAIDILCGLLSGSGFGLHMHSPVEEPEKTNDTGHGCIAIDISKFMELGEFSRLMRQYTQELASLRPAPGFDRVLMPGAVEAQRRSARRASGIPLPLPVHDELRAYAERYALPFDIAFCAEGESQ